MRKEQLTPESRERDANLEALEAARREYDVALSTFGEAVEPEIIDESIYLMEAARLKYSYFLRRIRTIHGSSSEPRF